ncbi:MAG: CpaF family protein [Anaerolineales bacterium]|nr:CpaF family protein [Anaerolineales bacterium]
MSTPDLLTLLAPLEPLLTDPHVVEILADRHDRVYVERHGRFTDVPSPFRDEAHMLQIMRAIAASVGRRLDAANPLVDARLPDGSRVNLVVPPVAITGPALVIRRFPAALMTWEQLVGYGSVSQPCIDFLRACVHGRLNIAVAGGTGSGKTTVLNLISSFIPEDERVVTVETASELRPRPNLQRLVRLESQPAAEERPEVPLRALVQNALRMRPDRLLVGEVSGPELLDVLQAMNTGHDGTMFALHAGSPHDALTRMEGMVSMANLSLPLLTTRQMLAGALDLITYQERLPDGSRKLLKITEVVGMQGDSILLQDLFVFQETGRENGRITGAFTATGAIPAFAQKLHAAGIPLPLDHFRPT